LAWCALGTVLAQPGRTIVLPSADRCLRPETTATRTRRTHVTEYAPRFYHSVPPAGSTCCRGPPAHRLATGLRVLPAANDLRAPRRRSPVARDGRRTRAPRSLLRGLRGVAGVAQANVGSAPSGAAPTEPLMDAAMRDHAARARRCRWLHRQEVCGRAREGQD